MAGLWRALYVRVINFSGASSFFIDSRHHLLLDPWVASHLGLTMYLPPYYTHCLPTMLQMRCLPTVRVEKCLCFMHNSVHDSHFLFAPQNDFHCIYETLSNAVPCLKIKSVL